MKLIILAAIAAGSFTQPARAESPYETLDAKAVSCVKDGAQKITAVSTSLVDAVNFLIEDLCVVDIHHAETYATSERTLEEWKATTASSQLVGIRIDPNTGELKSPPGFSAPFNANMIMANALQAVGSPRDTYRAVAANAVLEVKSGQHR